MIWIFPDFPAIIKTSLAFLLYFKDVRRWQFLTMKAAETLCIVCSPLEKYIF